MPRRWMGVSWAVRLSVLVEVSAGATLTLAWAVAVCRPDKPAWVSWAMISSKGLPEPPRRTPLKAVLRVWPGSRALI
ncbi:MAG: hypothetical protein HY794_02920 [Desulfarculus sp.]|nr:hypothetical protein [Desulfarculus sp.]